MMLTGTFAAHYWQPSGAWAGALAGATSAALGVGALVLACLAGAEVLTEVKAAKAKTTP